MPLPAVAAELSATAPDRLHRRADSVHELHPSFILDQTLQQCHARGYGTHPETLLPLLREKAPVAIAPTPEVNVTDPPVAAASLLVPATRAILPPLPVSVAPEPTVICVGAGV